ncbi:sugar transferase [Pseudophaeobacter sp.]|uniref:sugar transferase n=1 Tax=Pseudophaeobacter sp. TaxID=1971739 RepID=UPI004058DBED
MKDFVSNGTAYRLSGEATPLTASQIYTPLSSAALTAGLTAGAPYGDRLEAGHNVVLQNLPQRNSDSSNLRHNGREGHSAYSAVGKRVLDIVLVLLALPVALPIILLAALCLWVESGLPFYCQDRLGQHGKKFRIFKLRTMVRDADARLQRCLQQDPELRREWDETQKLKKDPRITPVGRILRMTSLDELPQLWNVFTGEMSLVGPRPMMPEQLPLYGEPSAYFAVKPGITGLWQVSTRNESSFASRAAADADYLRAMGLQLDLALIWRTVGVVARGTGY